MVRESEIYRATMWLSRPSDGVLLMVATTPFLKRVKRMDVEEDLWRDGRMGQTGSSTVPDQNFPGIY